jgi:hypothetical protein
MFARNLINTSILDRLKLNNGIEALKNYYHDLVIRDTEKALSLINDKSLSFSSLFILYSEIKKFNLINYLNRRNKYTLKIVNQILSKKKLNLSKLSTDEKQIIYSSLKWIIETGYLDDGLNNQYDEILDAAVSLILIVFKDKSDIHIIIELIFNRHKKNTFNYDLIWALFETGDPNFLLLIANRLTSNQWKDIELAQKLLKFIPGSEFNVTRDNVQQYQHAVRWLQDNYLFLQYTGECFQQTSTPIPYKVSLEAKYLCKPIAANSEKSLKSLSEMEQSLLNKFKNLTDETKILLSNYSFSINRQNIDWWNMWIHSPVVDQIHYAKSVGGLL